MDTVYRVLEPATTFDNGYKLYSEDAAHSWRRKRRQATKAQVGTLPAAGGRVGVGSKVRIGAGTTVWVIDTIEDLVTFVDAVRSDTRTSIPVEDIQAGKRRLTSLDDL